MNKVFEYFFARFFLLCTICFTSVSFSYAAENDDRYFSDYLLYLDVLHTGRSLEKYTNYDGRLMFVRSHNLMPGSECTDDDPYYCFKVGGGIYYFAVPKDEISSESGWRFDEVEYHVIRERFIPWNGETRKFYVIEASDFDAQRERIQNHYIYNREFGLIMFYRNSRMEDDCHACLSASAAFMLAEPERGFGAVQE